MQASTGSGKTLAFLIPIFEKLLKDFDKYEPEDVRALIISPTRELAYQIYKVASKFSEAVGKVGVKCSFGKSGEKEGADAKKESEFAKNGQNILIITPGRLAEALKDNLLDLKSIDFLILGKLSLTQMRQIVCSIATSKRSSRTSSCSCQSKEEPVCSQLPSVLKSLTSSSRSD